MIFKAYELDAMIMDDFNFLAYLYFLNFLCWSYIFF